MIKIIDIDELFDKYISDYVYQNIGKVKPEEIENKIPELYVEFGVAPLKELDGKSPVDYYKSFSGEQLVACLKEHLEKGVSVPDFLCEALESDKKNETALVNALGDESNEEFTIYVMNVLSSLDSEKCVQRYLEFIAWDYSETIKELATEYLKARAEKVKEKILELYLEAQEKNKEYLVEILSYCKNDQRVFDILLAEFVAHPKQIPVYANYLAKYGDERALDVLYKEIEREKISYADFEELRFAIEALGGSYDKVRNFKSDKTYKKIKGEENKD